MDKVTIDDMITALLKAKALEGNIEVLIQDSETNLHYGIDQVSAGPFEGKRVIRITSVFGD